MIIIKSDIMNSILKVILILTASSLFLGCQQKPQTYVDLIKNPELLQDKVAACHLNDTADCKMVLRAAQDYSVMNTERQENPELFGQKILQAQQELARVIAAKGDVDAQREHVNAMLAVVSSTSPE